MLPTDPQEPRVGIFGESTGLLSLVRSAIFSGEFLLKFFILLMVFFSGLTGLIYQITWQKYLAIYLGSHALSSTLTLSCFFLFLAAGFHCVGRFGHRLGSNRIKTYGIIEGLIGVYAIISPTLFFALYKIWPSAPSNSPSHFLLSFLFALSLMGIPTFLMGATIPLLTQGLSRKLQEGHRIHAWVYGINTLGAFFGSLFAGFYLLENFGLAQTLNLTGILNCLVFLFILVSLRVTGRVFSGFTPATSTTAPTGSPKILLSVAFLSGFLSFGVESLSIRMAGFAVGSSNYTYCIIVSAFIAAIAIGSFLAAAVKDKVGLKVLVFSQLALFATLVGLYLNIPHWPDTLARVSVLFAKSEINFNPYWASVFFTFFVTLLLPVCLLGITLPLLFQQLKNSGQFLTQTAGKMYAVNAFGAAAGAILGGYVFFFYFSAHQVFQLLLLVALVNFAFILIHGKFFGLLQKGVVLALACGLLWLPSWSDTSFVPSRFSLGSPPKTAKEYKAIIANFNNNPNMKVLYSDFGPNTYTVVTANQEDQRTLYVNAKADADTKGDKHTRSMTALFPLAFSKTNSNIFIVGLGTGMSTGMAASLPTTKNVTVAEISKGAIDAMPFFSQWNFEIEKNSSKISIENDDAYKSLKTSKDKYDLIFSEPSNTWVTGVEKIYTSEFLQMAASKLKPQGFYSQWFPLFMMTEPGFLAILKNFRSAFPHVTLWNAGGGSATIILASHSPISLDEGHFAKKDTTLRSLLQAVNIESTKDLLFQEMFSDSDTEILAEMATMEHSLFHPRLAYESGKAHFLKNIVNIDELADKYFVPMNDEAPVAQDLVWQKNIDLLDEDFFQKAETYYKSKTQTTLPLGRLFIARGQHFPPQKPNEKVTHYRYLQAESPARIPKSKDQKSIFPELFQRYLRLKKLRQTGHIKNVVQSAPDRCKDAPCSQAKLEILERLGRPEVAKLRTMIVHDQKDQAKVQLDALFLESTKTL